jgi:uncharacterized protein YkwD
MSRVRRDDLLAFGPFIAVAIIAIVVASAGFAVTPRNARDAAIVVGAPTVSRDAPVTASATQTAPAPSPSARASDPRANDASEMLQLHNTLRAAVGAPAVRADDRVSAAAQRHAEYLARAAVIGHEETPGEAGFTGVTVRDRLAAAGYADATASEVAASSGSGTDDVRYLWDLPYHRLSLMHPHAAVVGWGHAESGGRGITVGVIVFDFSAAAPELVRSPAAGQRVPSSWDLVEFPDPLPGAARPAGYPIVAVYANAKPVDLRAATLTDSRGQTVPTTVIAQIYERDYVALAPSSPLAPGSRYRIRLELTVGGADTVTEWEFETLP